MLEERDKVRTAGLQLGIPLKPYGFFSRSPEMFARSWTKITHDKGEEEKKNTCLCNTVCCDGVSHVLLGLGSRIIKRCFVSYLGYFVSYTSDCFS